VAGRAKADVGESLSLSEYQARRPHPSDGVTAPDCDNCVYISAVHFCNELGKKREITSFAKNRSNPATASPAIFCCNATRWAASRASGGVKLSYPIASSRTLARAPYVGLYGDYYFNSDNATAAVAASGLPAAIVLDGWSARATGGIAAKFGDGGQIAVGAERAGIGGSFGFWTYRARASVPF
jgi:hypothetical protein